jgi:hypothetical protein
MENSLGLNGDYWVKIGGKLAWLNSQFAFLMPVQFKNRWI